MFENDKKFWTIFAAVMVGIVALFIFLVGLPSKEYYHFEDSKIVCKKWSDTWHLGYQHNQCWQLEQINNAN